MSENTITANVAVLDAPAKPAVSDAQVAAWEKQGETIRKAAAINTWKIADWFVKGDGYGFAKRAAEILDGLYSYNSLYQMGVVARVFTAEFRNPAVSMGIHQVLTAMARENMEAAQALLTRAQSEKLTVKAVKAELGIGTSDKPQITNGSDAARGTSSLDLEAAEPQEGDEFKPHKASAFNTADDIIAALEDLKLADAKRVMAALREMLEV